MRRSLSSTARLCRQFSQENRDDIRLTIKSDSFESVLPKNGSKQTGAKGSEERQGQAYPEGIEFRDGQKGTVVAINGPVGDPDDDRAMFEAQDSQEGVKLKAPQNSVDDSIKSNNRSNSNDTDSLNSPVFQHKRVNSAQRRKDFATSVRRAKQILNQEMEGSIHSSGSLCKSCGSWCSLASFQSESHRDSLTSCHTCSPRLLSSKESGFSRSVDYESVEYARSRMCSRCSLESDETGLGGMDFASSRNSETMSLSSHRHHHHRSSSNRHQAHNNPSSNASRHHHHHRHHRHRRSKRRHNSRTRTSSGSYSQHHTSSPHNSIGWR